MKFDIDPVVYGWCRDHGLSVLDPEADAEFGIWCSEVDSMKEIDVNDDGDYVFVYGYDVAESRWLREVELEDKILREEYYDSYTEFLEGPYVDWVEEVEELYQLIEEWIMAEADCYEPEMEPNDPY